jgi:serine protease AprX
VQPGMSKLDVYATIDTALEDGEGNTVALLLTAPDGRTYSSGIALPILDAPSREVVVDNPLAGSWLLEVRGVRGLAAAPNFSLPTSGAAAPGPVDGTITQQQFTLAPVPDIATHPLRADIETALKSRLVDVDADGKFRPDTVVRRDYFARVLTYDTGLRQTLGAAPRFTDVPADLEPIAEAVTANGSTTRDFDFVPAGLMSAGTTTFNPSGSVTRLDAAVALVRALGHDAEARAKANTIVTSNGVPIVDNAQIPGALRGYVQIALDLGIFDAFPTETRQNGRGQLVVLPGPRFEPATTMVRSVLASTLLRYSTAFAAGR